MRTQRQIYGTAPLATGRKKVGGEDTLEVAVGVHERVYSINIDRIQIICYL
jgi:hypothetical protein